MKNKNLFIYKAAYFLSAFVLAIGSSQYVTYLARIGYDSNIRGFMVSIYSITAMILQLLLGQLVDRYQKVKQIFIICVLICSIGTMLFFQLETQSMILHLLLLTAAGGLATANVSLLDTLIFSYDEKITNAYSIIRMFGSIGWAFSCLVVSFIISKFEYAGLGIYCLLSCIILCLVLTMMPSPNAKSEEKVKITWSDTRQLLNKNYIILVSALFFMSCTAATSSTAITDKMLALGASASDVSLRWSLSAFVEIPAFIIGSNLIKRFGHYKLLIFCGLTLVFQYFLYAFSTSIMMILIVTILQMISTPIMTLSSRYLIRDLSPKKLQSTAFMLAVSLYSSVATIIMPSIGGMITYAFDVDITLLSASAFSVIGTIFASILKKISVENKKQTHRN